MENTSRGDQVKLESESVGSPKYWQSLEQWRQDPEFQQLAEKEFKSSPFPPDDSQGGWARREFLKLMGASLALSSFGCVRRPLQKLVPYANRPDEVVPGLPNYYSSTLIDGNEGFGLVVKTREGRPIKLEGHPNHPVNQGKLSARVHGMLLGLYDPDRLPSPRKNLLNPKRTNRDTISISYSDLDKEIGLALKKGKVGLLTGSYLSPATKNLVGEFKSSFGAKHLILDNTELNSYKSAQQKSYGSSAIPRLLIDKAEYILTIDCDLLGTFISPVEFSRMFAQGRNPDGNMNKLVSIESNLSMTGMNADERYRIKPSEQFFAALALLKVVIETGSGLAGSSDSRVKGLIDKYSTQLEALSLPKHLLEKLASELIKNKGKSIVVTGGAASQTEASESLNIVVNLLNSILGNEGKTIDGKSRVYTGYQGSSNELDNFKSFVEKGELETIIIHGINPAYNQAESSGFLEALKKVKTVIYCGDRNDETGRVSHYVVPDHHSLENWGDSEVQDGVFAIQQPTIQPLYSTRAFQESLMSWAKAAGKNVNGWDGDWYAYLRNFWRWNIWSRNRGKGLAKSDFEDFWQAVLQEGVFDVSSNSPSARSFNYNSLSAINVATPTSGLELVIYPSVILGDGRWANSPWLQEVPDPVSKICWDNYLNVSPQYAQAHHLKEGQILEVGAGEKKILAPCHIQPGLHDEVVSIMLGYGRVGSGKVADEVGVNVNPLIAFADGQSIYSGIKVHVKPTDGEIQLACPQGHHTMEGRNIVVEATFDQYQKDPAANIHKHEIFSMWNKHEYKGHKWGMAVDLNSCNGCSACVVACQSENNVHVVGKKYVIQGRIMHWIRVDRYYTGQPDEPGVVTMPVMCQHCDNAPCETVCPVAATTHSSEGLNDMTYNRCVGTRYCANNCPYKVRRFNWFNYVKDVREPLNMAYNPEVTVRSRGVMEKCSFCKPRINEAKEKAKRESRALKDGDVVTACQQSCPSGAIVFGDMNDENSKVSQLFKKQNSYSLLEELNAVPAVRYQTKIRNTEKLKANGGHHESQGGHA